MELLRLHPSVPNKNVYIIAPTYDQVVDIYWPLLVYEMGMDSYALKASRDVGRFIFPNNVELRLVSHEAIERMRGKGGYFVVSDEVSSWKKAKETWEGIIQPVIVTRWSPANAAMFDSPNPGRGLIIGTPKGFNYFYDMHNFAETDNIWRSYQYDYTTSPYLDKEEIERIKHTVDPIQWASEYLAQFNDSGASVFYAFDRKTHVNSALLDFQEGEEVHVGIDFNIGIQASNVFAVRQRQVHLLHCIKGHHNTEDLAADIAGRWKGHRIYVYPDPTGGSRHTSSPVGSTDLTILKSAGLTVRARSKSPPIIDSVNAVNRKLMTAGGDIGFWVHPRCKPAIESLERTQWVDRNPSTATIDKTKGDEHFSDALRYPIEYLFPINQIGPKVHRGFAF